MHSRLLVRLHILCNLLLIRAFTGRLSAQNTWGDYRPGTIRETIQRRDSLIRATPANELPTWIIPGNQLPTRAVVIYRGDSRPIDSTRREIIRRWSMSFLRDSSVAGLFSREYLFQEGRQELWLPVQDKVARFFPRELQQGQAVTLYIVWLGAYYAGGDITWAFAVNEFDADSTTR